MGKVLKRQNQPNGAKNPGTNAQDDLGLLPQRYSLGKFWILGEPETREAERRRAKWNRKEEPLCYESIICPIDPEGHRRAGARTSQLSIVLPNLEPQDFVWTYFECLVQDRVIQFFKSAGFTGWEIATAKARFATRSKQPPTFWELRVIGSAGIISPLSGYKMLRRCSACGLIDDDTKIEDPTKVVDESKWDGADFFRVERISGFIFVTDRVVQALYKSNFTGWKAYSLQEMKETFDIVVPDRTQ
jgi:hypothetical protein